MTLVHKRYLGKIKIPSVLQVSLREECCPNVTLKAKQTCLITNKPKSDVCDPLEPLKCCSNVCVGHYDQDNKPVYKEGTVDRLTGEGQLQYVCGGDAATHRDKDYEWKCDIDKDYKHELPCSRFPGQHSKGGDAGKKGGCSKPTVEKLLLSWAGGKCAKSNRVGHVDIGGTVLSKRVHVYF